MTARLAAVAIDHHQLTERLSHQAEHDALTGLANRMLCIDRLEQAISLAARHSQKVGVLFLDLDGFKSINDELGHKAGDAVLREAARRILQCVRNSDTTARLGGDEFVLILQDVEQTEGTVSVARKIIQSIKEPFVIPRAGQASLTRCLTGSIGIAVYPQDGSDAESLIQNADAAMYRVKQTGKNRCLLFSEIHHAQPGDS
jgi:diguanylate cyclase (GGDEF)-like protein